MSFVIDLSLFDRRQTGEFSSLNNKNFVVCCPCKHCLAIHYEQGGFIVLQAIDNDDAGRDASDPFVQAEMILKYKEKILEHAFAR